MEFLINVKNADKSMLKAIKAMLETKPSIDFTITQTKTKTRLESAIAEVERGKTIKCKDFNEFKTKVLS